MSYWLLYAKDIIIIVINNITADLIMNEHHSNISLISQGGVL